MARKKPTRCKTCGYVLKEVPGLGNGWAHKKKEHWLDKPHKAIPAERPLAVSVPAS